MLSKYERETLKRDMHPELDARPGVVAISAMGLLVIAALSMAAPAAQLLAAGDPTSLASAHVLERLVGIAE